MKTLKIIALALILSSAVIAFGSTALSETASVTNTENVSVKFAPEFVWIKGHYKVDRFGFVVWVPGHWRRI